MDIVSTKKSKVGAMIIRVKKKYFLFDVDRNELKHYRFNPFLAQLPNPAKTIKEAYEMLKPKEVNKALKKGLKVKRQGEWFFIPCNLKKVPKKPEIQKQLQKRADKIPQSERYGIDIDRFNSDEGEVIEIKKGKDYLKEILPKYRKQLIERVEDYNKEATKYQKVLKEKKEWKAKYEYFEYGGELQAGDNRPNTVEELLKLNGVTYVKGLIEHTGREHEPIELKSWYIAVPNTAIESFTITGNID